MKSLLEREDLDQMPEPPPPEEKDTVLERVENLGYIPPTIHAARKKAENARNEAERKRQDRELPLATALRKAGIKPFVSEGIHAYKEKMCYSVLCISKKEMSAGFSTILQVVGLGSTAALYLLLAIFDVVLGSVICGPVILLCWVKAMVYLSKNEGKIKHQSALEFFVAGPIGTLPLLWGERYEWNQVSLKDYKEDIPREVLATVAEINFHCEDATFFVEYLERRPDPLLGVRRLSECYYVEVWKEPRFDGKRLA